MSKDQNSDLSARNNVRLTTIFAGRICQYGRAFECIISDVSVGGAKVRLKNPADFEKFTTSTPVQLTFERLTDYKALNAQVAWLRPNEDVVGLEFSDSELRRRIIMKKLMPNRWRIAMQGNDEKTEPPNEV
ncbi:MAG: hypothetical protein COB59_05165 [Rhodospirillaceae bacterium]|nr:MAG: hypothetical protein COB59_05165 [Rhodospirillaceae bacterium]